MIVPVRQRLLGLRLATLDLDRVSPITDLERLQLIVTATSPAAIAREWYVSKPLDSADHRYRRLLLEPHRIDGAEFGWVERLQLEIASYVDAVEAEISARLGDRASVGWLVRRYAERCRQLRAPELRASLAKVTRQNERALTRNMATYLFDQGLDVLIELQLGAARYDVYAPALLVEAKVCSASTSALRAAAEGLRQISSYQIQLRNERAKVDPILAIFCIGGPPPDMPHEHTVGSLTVSIIVVDVAPPNQRGHRASASVHVTPAQIASELQRITPKERAKRGARRR